MWPPALLLALVLLPGVPEALLADTNAPAGPGGLPKWEAGIFAGATRLPHYKGSAGYDTYVLPIPYFIYRGDWIQSDREGLRGIFFKNLRFESVVSLSGHPPVDDDAAARRGMPDLSPLLEAGPALKWWPFGRRGQGACFVQLAARATTSIDVDDGFDMAYEGLRGELSLHYARAFRQGRWRLGGALAGYAGDSRYHGYFHDVPARYATETRPAYDSGSGYGGCGLSLFLTRKLTKTLSGGLYARWDHLGGAVFRESPLVERDDSFTLGAALIWRFARSTRRVGLPE
jgi:MipA family protein